MRPFTSRRSFNLRYSRVPSPETGFVQPEIENVKKLGVDIETNVIIGKSVTVDELMDEEGYKAVFIGSGAVFRDSWNPGRECERLYSLRTSTSQEAI